LEESTRINQVQAKNGAGSFGLGKPLRLLRILLPARQLLISQKKPRTGNNSAVTEKQRYRRLPRLDLKEV
jgi:hypothetical protein